MGLIISLDYEVQNPHTLYVMEDEAAAVAHAERYCANLGLEFNPSKLRAKAECNGRTFRMIWGWPRTIHGVWRKPGPWVWLHAGREFSVIELHTHIPGDELNYLIGRMRGQPVENEG
ncbi:hypothetical protein D3C75_511820 [compost metagenome]